MSEQEMPDRIWAKTHGASTDVISGARGLIGGWNEHRREGQHEYRRADLPPTPAEAMRCPEVMALVEALGDIAGGDPTIDDPEVDAERSARIARAALAALEQAVRHE